MYDESASLVAARFGKVIIILLIMNVALDREIKLIGSSDTTVAHTYLGRSVFPLF